MKKIRCGKCLQYNPLEEFSRNNTREDHEQRQSCCRECHAEFKRLWREGRPYLKLWWNRGWVQDIAYEELHDLIA